MKDVEDKYYTFDEYKTLIKDSQTDKEGTLIYLYTTNKAMNSIATSLLQRQRLQRSRHGWSARCSRHQASWNRKRARSVS
jgi:hypothetical protein